MRKLFSTLFKFLGKGLSENNGQPSSIRIMVFYAFVLWSTGIFIGLIVTIFLYRELWVTVLGMILGGMFSLVGVKAYQKGKESSAPLGLTAGKSETGDQNETNA